MKRARPDAKAADGADLVALVQKLPPEVKEQIVVNVAAMARVLGDGQHAHRRPFTAGAFEHVDTNHVVQLTGFKADTIREARRAFKGDLLFGAELFASKAKKTGPGSRSRAVDRKADARAFLEQKTRVTVSGDRKDRFQTFASKWDTYKTYKDNQGTAGYCLFAAAWSDLKVTKAKHAEFDFFSCEVCNGAPLRITEMKQQRDALEKKEMDQAERELQQMEIDADIAKLQVCCSVMLFPSLTTLCRPTSSCLRRSVTCSRRREQS